MSAKNKHLCIHGHFYQPPRENPWTGAVDPEESARPHRDWNSRIAQECYGPNASAPLLGEDGLIAAMADNYEKISFNFGATLLSWLEREQPAIYKRILAADAASVKARGFGNAVAQPYFHDILPLQSAADKRTLLRWGLSDFERRFGRKAEGVWLPETGVDEDTLEALLDFGARFTILAPSQAARVRAIGAPDWRDVEAATLQPTRPYRWSSKRRPGKHLALFFFHQGLHEAVVGGEAFAAPDALFKKIWGRTRPDDSVELVNLATDGEFFGHHHRKGAAALTRTLMLAEDAGLSVVNPAQFLAMFPPPEEVEIRPDTAWSCEHGLGRWTTDCGCRSPHLKEWSQAWRGPLREALNWLSDELLRLYETKAGDYLVDYKRARELYDGREPERFAEEEGFGAKTPERRTRALQLVELQRQRLAAFTSCGWFFDDISGIETVQCLSHAARALELAERLGMPLTEEFERRLARAPSNVKAFGDGAGVYRKLVLPRRVGFERMAAHWAILDHLRRDLAVAPPDWRVTAGQPARAVKREESGRLRVLSAQRLELTRRSTLETRAVTVVVHQRDRLDFAARVGPADLDASSLFAAFEREDDETFEKTLNAALGASFFGLDALLPEDRAEALRWITPDPSLGAPKRRDFLDRWVAAMAELRAGAGGERCLDLLDEAKALKLPADRLPWVSAARARLLGQLESLLGGADEAALSRAGRWLEAFESAGLHVDVWQLQDLFWRWRAALNERGASPAERRLAAAFGEKLGFADSALPLETSV